MQTIALDKVLIRLAAKGYGSTAVETVARSVREMVERGAASEGFDVEDLYRDLEGSGRTELANLLRETVAELNAEQMTASQGPHAYNVRKWNAILQGVHAPAGSAYGKADCAIDERVVEYPWVFDRLGQKHPRGDRVLDAGSVMNFGMIQAAWREHGFGPLSVVTLCYEGQAQVSDQFRYEFADLRELPYRDQWFSSVLCISTLEHIGMDNTLYGAEGQRACDAQGEAIRAVDEMARVLAPGGTFLLSVPFGKPSDRGWLRIFSRAEVQTLVELPHWSHSRVRIFRAFPDGWREVSAEEAVDAGYNDPRGVRDAPDWVVAAEAVALIECVRAGEPRRASLSPCPDREATHPEYGYRFKYPADDRYVGAALAKGAYEPIESAIFASLIQPDSVVIDVGANLGHYSMVAASRIDPDRGRVVAFEPNSRAHALLTENLKANGLDFVQPQRAAVGETAGSVTLRLNAANPGDHRVFSADRDDWGAGAEQVECVDLDSFVEAHGIEPSVVKLDVQGYEYFVLKGMSRLLARSKRLAVFLEFSPDLNSTGGVDTQRQLDLIRDAFEEIYCIDPREGHLTPLDTARVREFCEADEHINLLCLNGYDGRLPGLTLDAEPQTVPESTTPVPAPSTPRWTRRLKSRTLGVVMIVKDEAENLPALFETIAAVADEVVVVDTGSTDGTRALCRAWGVTLLTEVWRDDFAWARNRGIQAATAKFLLWLDADDRLPEETQRELIRMRDDVLPTAERSAYELWVHNVDARGTTREEFLQVRLFPRLPAIRFHNPVHEELVTSLEQTGLPRKRTALVIVHTGYASPELLRRKHARNEELLRKSLRARGDNVHNLVHLAHAVGATGRAVEAEQLLTRALAVEESGSSRRSLLAELHAFRAMIRIPTHNRFAAMRDLERAIALWPEWAVPYAILADLYQQKQEHEQAWQAIEAARRGEFPPSSVGLNVRRARSGMECTAGCLLVEQGRTGEALDAFRTAVGVDPSNLTARLQLGQLLLDVEEFQSAREVLEPAGDDEAAVPRFVEVASAIGLARATTGDPSGAAACLAPLLDILEAELGGAQDVSPVELAAAALRAGHATASRNLLTLFEKTLATAA